MRVNVRLFSLFRERAGVKEATLDLPPAARVAEAIRALQEMFPRIAPLVEGDHRLLLVSVNREYSSMEATLDDGDELALFPPVSGGAVGALLLLSGGFDSPVAGQMARDHGFGLEAVHFSMEPVTDDASSRKSTELARMLGVERLTVVPIGRPLAEIARVCRPRAYFVLQKRFMYRLAARIARRKGSRFLVTGENLGQVSSQTLVNLGAIDAVAELPVLRPLLGLDKTQIIDLARRLGTFELSKGPEVCDVLGPKHPSTSVALEHVVEEEAKLDLEGLLEQALEGAFEVETAKGYASPRARSVTSASSTVCD